MGARVQNNTIVTFVGTGATVTHVTLWNAATGGQLKGMDTLGTAQPLPARIPVNSLSLVIADGTEFTDSSDIDAAEGRKGGVTHVQAHSGSPGANGAANVIAGIARQPISWGSSVAV